jgi:hypothetical protein
VCIGELSEVLFFKNGSLMGSGNKKTITSKPGLVTPPLKERIKNSKEFLKAIFERVLPHRLFFNLNKKT